jgi:hypothetical protein
VVLVTAQDDEIGMMKDTGAREALCIALSQYSSSMNKALCFCSVGQPQVS